MPSVHAGLSDVRETGHASAPHGGHLDANGEAGELGVRCLPGRPGAHHATQLLGVDHLGRRAEPVAGLLLHLAEDEPAPSPKHEIELVAPGASVRLEEAVATQAVVASGDALAAIHAAAVSSSRSS